MNNELSARSSFPAFTPRLSVPSGFFEGTRSQALWVLSLTLLLVFGHNLPAAKFFSDTTSYLPLHTALEFVAMSVSGMVFALAWNLRSQPGNNHRILLGAGFLAVALIDTAHTLSYAGMPDFVTASGPEKAINFWLAARLVAVSVLLAVAVLPVKRWSPLRCYAAVGIALGFAAVCWWVGIMHRAWLPRTFVTGQGLTPFKVSFEYLLATLYGLAAVLLFLRSRRSGSNDLLWLATAAWVQGLSEMFFTLYVNVSDLFNLFGHIYKAIAYVMVYRALFVAGVRAPYRELDLEHARLHALLSAIPDLIWLKDTHGFYLSCNKAFERFCGLTQTEIVGAADHDFVDAEVADFFIASDQAVMAAGTTSVNEEWLTFPDQSYRGLFEVTKTPMYTEGGQIIGVLGIAHDITSRKATEDEIRNLAFFDPLTHLANRRMLIERLKQAMTASARHQKKGALLYIDLDNFKPLNDTQGHHIGDLLLQQVAQRLVSCVREGDTVARLGGDEFLVMLEDLSHNGPEAAAQVETVGHKILTVLNQTYRLGGHEHHSTASIGITLFGDSHDECNVNEFLKRADLAMYQAKAAGRNTLRFFDPGMQAVVTARAELEAGLREALLKNQFVLYYQAQVDTNGHLTGVEALLRWQHPQRGMVSPLDFIPLAEETGVILPLGGWVLMAACKQLALWASQPELAHLTIAVNVSARQFHHPDFVAQVLMALEHTGSNPHRLKLELTESLLVKDVEDVIVKMSTLKSQGVSFSLDDFGTGYSSLSYLKRLPLEQLKIDQSFVRDILSDPNDAAIAATIVTLAHSLGLGVIAEGVETAEQRDRLASIGCHAYQGYFFSKPLPIGQFEDYMHRH